MKYELWRATNAVTGELVHRLIRAESITANEPVANFFERHLDAPELVGTVNLVAPNIMHTLADCYKEE